MVVVSCECPGLKPRVFYWWVGAEAEASAYLGDECNNVVLANYIPPMLRMDGAPRHSWLESHV